MNRIFHCLACMALALAALAPLHAQSDIFKPSYPALPAIFLPDPAPEMPAFARLFYSPTLNVYELEAAYEAYLHTPGTQSADHKPWIKYYERLLPYAYGYSTADGTVRPPTAEEESRTFAKEQREQQRKSSTGGDWKNIGPSNTLTLKSRQPEQIPISWNVNVYTLDVHEADPNIIYAGTETGALFKTTDKGITWELLAADTRFPGSMVEVSVSATNPDSVMISAANNLYLSTDGGTSWASKLAFDNLNCNHIDFNPRNSLNIIAGTSNGVYVTHDGGETWSNALTGRLVYTVLFKANDPNTLFALLHNAETDRFEFHKSTDGGQTFAHKTTGWINDTPERSGGRMAVTPADPNTVVAFVIDSAGTSLVRSRDAGESWSLMEKGPNENFGVARGQGFYDLDVMIDAENPDGIIAGTVTSYRTADGGQTWEWLGGYGGKFRSIHPDMQRFKSVGGDTWLANDGGLVYSNDFFEQHQESRIDGMTATEFWGYHQGWNHDIMGGGRNHNGNVVLQGSYPEGLGLQVGGGETATGWVMHHRKNHILFSDIPRGFIMSDSILEESIGTFDYGDHPYATNRGHNRSEWLFDPEYYNHHYLGRDSSFFKSTDGGRVFNKLASFPRLVYHLGQSRANPDIFYTFTIRNGFKSVDGGHTWEEMPNLPIRGPKHQWKIYTDPTDENRFWLLCPQAEEGSRIWRSDDGGETYVNLSTPTIAPYTFHSLAYGDPSDGTIYVPSSGGPAGTGPMRLFYRNLTDSDWTEYSDGLPASFNVLKAIPFYRDGVLRMAGNRGVYESPLAEPNFQPLAQPTVEFDTVFCATDTIQFEDYSILNHNGATWQWSFTGAAYVSDPGARNPRVIFNELGDQTATLTVTQGGRSSTKDLTVHVQSLCTPDTLPGQALYVTKAESGWVEAPPSMHTFTEITMSAWVRHPGGQNERALIVGMRGGTVIPGIHLFSNNELGYRFAGGAYDNYRSGHIVTPDKWHHVALTIYPDSAVVYLDGVPAKANLRHRSLTVDFGVYLGRHPFQRAKSYEGLMDEVRIYDRALSRDEIRESMHLVADPLTDPGLIHYFQFNEGGNRAIDRAGSRHGLMAGTAMRQLSTAPVGAGVAHHLPVFGAGSYTFGDTDLSITFPPAGPYPDGDVVVSHITSNNADVVPDVEQMQDRGYWIVHNFGANREFADVEAITFAGVAPPNAAIPEENALYRRPACSDGPTWGDALAVGSAATASSVTFGGEAGLRSLNDQFTIGLETVLPLDWLDFRVRLGPGGKTGLLNWETANENNTSHFVVERSADGREFSDAGTVAARGTGEVNSYRYEDLLTGRGTFYYRLRQYDQDGTFAYSPVRRLILPEYARDFVVFPNPAAVGQPVYVRTNYRDAYRIQVYDLKGRRLIDRTQSGDVKLASDELVKGTYTYTIDYGNRFTGGRFIIQ